MRTFAFGAALASVLTLAACTNTDTAEVTDVLALSATVASVDAASRNVTLTTPAGETIRVTAPPEMRNFDQIEPGDVATLEIYGSVAVSVADALAPDEPQTLAMLGRAPEGARPGAVAGAITTMTLEFVAYDPVTREAELILPDGEEIVVYVEPAMQAFAAARQSGERIEVTFSDAVALFVEPGPA